MAPVGRPREFDREAALHAAMLVFWKKGFLATSMNDLCEAMGIRSPSLYAAFGSKEDLYIEAVERYNAAANTLIWNHVKDGPTAKDGVRSALLAAATVLSGDADNPSGCLVNLAAGDDCAEAISKTLKSARSGGLKAFRSGIRRAVASGELPRTVNIDRLSRFYLSIVQGMAIQARDGASRAELAGMAEVAMSAWPA